MHELQKASRQNIQNKYKIACAIFDVENVLHFSLELYIICLVCYYLMCYVILCLLYQKSFILEFVNFFCKIR